MKFSDLLELLLLGAVWGASFMLMRTTVPEFGVFALVEVRAVLAFLFLMPFVILSKQLRDMRTHWKGLLVVGALNTAVPFCLFAYSSLHLDAGLNSILNGTAPMFGAIVAVLYLKEAISKVAMFGLFLGFFGVLVISQQTKGNAALSVLPIVAALSATACYGMAACYLKKHLASVKPFAIAAGSQLFAGILILPLALTTWPSASISTDAWLNASLLAVMCTGFAYVMYFRLIANVGASNALTVAYLVPLFGILWGVVILDETLSLQSIMGGVLIILGVMFTTGLFSRIAKNLIRART